jgi:hypothetical protein
MNELDKLYVLDLANESEKISESQNSGEIRPIDEENAEIAGWGKRNLSNSPRKSVTRAIKDFGRIFTRRASDSEAPSVQDSPIKLSDKFNTQINEPKTQKLPAIVTRNIASKQNNIQPMFNKKAYFRTESRGIEGSINSGIKRVLRVNELVQKQEGIDFSPIGQVYDFSPIRPLNKTFTVTVDLMSNVLKPKSVIKNMID